MDGTTSARQLVPNTRLVRRSLLVARAIAVLVVLVGAGHLAAWLTGYMAERGLTAITMKTNAALALVATGLSLLVFVLPNARPALRRAGQTLAVLAVVIGALTLAENLTDWDLGIDQLLATEPQGALGVFAANRMGIPACAGFLLAGLSLLMIGRGSDRNSRIGQLLALAVCLIALLACIGYLYGAQPMYAIARLTAIAWPTAAALLALGIGIVLARPAEGLMAQATADDPGGVALRRWPLVLVVPVALGWLRLAGERSGFFDAATGTALVMLLFMVTLSVVAYRGGVAVSRSSAAIMDREERLRLSHEATGMGAFDWDIRSGKNLWTPELEAIYGLSAGTFRNSQEAWEELMHPEDRSAMRETVTSALTTGRPLEAEWRTIWPDGSLHWISGRWRVFRDQSGAVVRMVGVNLEITHRKQIQQALEATVEDLERSNDQLEQFAYICAHDLQEPLRQVRTFAELLKRHLGKVDETASQYFNFIYTGAERMSDLVTGILEYSRVGRVAEAHEPADCERLLQDACLNLGSAISDAGAEVTHDPLPTVHGSAMQILQLFQNLIGNAIKFRRNGVAPRIHVGCRRGAGGWLFAIHDNGIGIPAEYHAKVFRIFQRLHGPDKYGGTGIGLAICQNIVESHRGRIWIDPDTKEGTTFCFTIPESRSAVSRPGAEAKFEAAGRRDAASS